MIPSFQTDRPSANSVGPDQTRLEQSDQGLHCMPFCLHILVTLLVGKAYLHKFQGDYSNLFGFSVFLGVLNVVNRISVK